MTREQEILLYADELSRTYYEKPLLFDYHDKRLLDIARETLSEYEVANSMIPQRICVSSHGEKAFGLRALEEKDNKYYDFEHTKEVFEEAVNDDVWDCVIVSAIRHKANVIVNPFAK